MNVIKRNQDVITGKDIIVGVEVTKYQFQKQFSIYTGIEISIEEIDNVLHSLYIE
jgi:shikimate 5-dehydrogenase